MLDEHARKPDAKERTAKIEAVELALRELMPESEAVPVVAKVLLDEDPALSSDELVTAVRRRCFLDPEEHDEWRTAFARPASAETAQALAKLVIAELAPRLGDAKELRQRLGVFGPQLPALLDKHATDAAAAYVSGPQLSALLSTSPYVEVRRVLLSRVWRDLIGSCLMGVDPGRWRWWIYVPVITRDDDRVREFLDEGRLIITCELIAVSDLIDFREPRLLDRLARRFAPRWEREETAVSEVGERRRPDDDESDEWPVDEPDEALDAPVLQAIPPREPTAEEVALLERVLGRAGAVLAEAIVHALAILVSRENNDQPGYATFLRHMAAGNDYHLTPLQRTHAYNALAKLIAPFGFVCGEPLNKATEKIGARHVLPPGLPFKTLREQASTWQWTLLERETARYSLKKIAQQEGLRWPAGPEADWTPVECLIIKLRGARLVARQVLHDHGRTRFIFEGGLVDMPPVPPHLRDTGASDADGPQVASGRVIGLPSRSLPVEAKADDPAFLRRLIPLLPRPLDRTHKGNWFYFPRGGVDV